MGIVLSLRMGSVGCGTHPRGGSPLKTEGPHTPPVTAGASPLPFSSLSRHDPEVSVLDGTDSPISCPLQGPSGHYSHPKPMLNMKRVLAPSLWSLIIGTMVVMSGGPSRTHGPPEGGAVRTF